ncbi:MAG: SDR family NAD(P)-dependent oxidoreductase, partial [Hyphomicrobiales bacterium]|nr:SDR family NAD(P)-dependent oxidoreductase [Hyphomicrobiales bacterium]
MGNLADKTVLLTGGLGTLGRAQATKLSAEGAQVVVLDRPDSEDGTERAAALGDNVSFFGCDLNHLGPAAASVAGRASELDG